MPVTWPTLRTWTDGDPVRPAYFNPVGDAENYLFRLHRRQAADQTVTVNTTIADLSMQDFIFTQGDFWIFKGVILYTNVAGANGVSVQVYGGPNVGAGWTASLHADRVTPANLKMDTQGSIGTALTISGPSTTTGGTIPIRGIYQVNVFSATLGINFSPFTVGNNATIKAGSWLIAERVVMA
jgi:hypothetical protein